MKKAEIAAIKEDEEKEDDDDGQAKVEEIKQEDHNNNGGIKMIAQEDDVGDDGNDDKGEKQDDESDEDEGLDGAGSMVVLDEIARVLHGTMRNGSNKYVKVKHLAVFTIFPKVVNMAQSFQTEDISIKFLQILVRSSKIDWGNKTEQQKYLLPFLNLHQDFLKSNALIYSSKQENHDILFQLFEVLQPYYTESTEQLKKEALKVTLGYLITIHQHLIEPHFDHKRTQILQSLAFLPGLTSSVLPLCKEYWDSVRENACLVMQCIVKNFLVFPPILDSKQKDLMQMVQASINLKFSSSYADNLREEADREVDELTYIFENAQTFLQKTITIMMDE